MTASLGMGPGVLLGLFLAAPVVSSVTVGPQELDPVLGRFARAWGAEDTAALQELLAATVRLEVDGREYLGVPPRQVAARIERLFRRFVPAMPRISRQGSLAESPDRGFAEFSWIPEASDSGAAVPYIVIASLRRSDGEWRISELRILH